MRNGNVSNENEAAQTRNQTIIEKHDDKKHLLMIPNQGGKGEQVIKSVGKTIKRFLPSNIKVQVSFTGSKLSSFFNIKVKTKFEHIMYFILGHVLKQRVMVIILVKQNDEFSRGLKATTTETLNH